MNAKEGVAHMTFPAIKEGQETGHLPIIPFSRCEAPFGGTILCLHRQNCHLSDEFSDAFSDLIEWVIHPLLFSFYSQPVGAKLFGMVPFYSLSHPERKASTEAANAGRL